RGNLSPGKSIGLSNLQIRETRSDFRCPLRAFVSSCETFRIVPPHPMACDFVCGSRKLLPGPCDFVCGSAKLLSGPCDFVRGSGKQFPMACHRRVSGKSEQVHTKTRRHKEWTGKKIPWWLRGKTRLGALGVRRLFWGKRVYNLNTNE